MQGAMVLAGWEGRKEGNISGEEDTYIKSYMFMCTVHALICDHICTNRTISTQISPT